MCITVDAGNNEEAVVFDTQKLAEALRSVYEAIERIMEPIREAMQTITEKISAIAKRMADAMRFCTLGISDDMRIVAQKIARLLTSWLTATCHYVVRVVVSYDPKAPARFAALVCVLVKSHSAAFLEHVCASRKGQLLRCQDRGSSDSVSDDDNNSTNISTMTFAAAA